MTAYQRYVRKLPTTLTYLSYLDVLNENHSFHLFPVAFRARLSRRPFVFHKPTLPCGWVQWLTFVQSVTSSQGKHVAAGSRCPKRDVVGVVTHIRHPEWSYSNADRIRSSNKDGLVFALARRDWHELKCQLRSRWIKQAPCHSTSGLAQAILCFRACVANTRTGRQVSRVFVRRHERIACALELQGKWSR